MQHVPTFTGNTADGTVDTWPQAIEEPAPGSGSQSAADIVWRVVEEWRGHASTPSKLMPYLDLVHVVVEN